MKRSTIAIPAVFCTLAALPASVLAQASGAASPAAQTPGTVQTSGSPQTSATVSALTPRGPEAIAQQDPNRVVAKIAGKDVTAKQALEMLQAIQPEDRKRYDNKLSDLLRQIYMEDQTADEAVRMKLDQQAPWKDQLRLSRANILTQAYLTQAVNNSASKDDPKAYYDAHAAEFDQVKLSGILVAFNPPGTPASASGVQRTEADAQTKADDLEKKIKGGGDFSALARTDSDNQQSSVRGGEIGTFTMDSQSIPPAVKDLVAKMQPQQVAEPFKVPGGFYIFKLDSRTKLPFEQVRSSIVQKQQADKAQALFKQQLDKYSIEVRDPDFFSSSTGAPASPKIPSLQRPAGASTSPAKP